MASRARPPARGQAQLQVAAVAPHQAPLGDARVAQQEQGWRVAKAGGLQMFQFIQQPGRKLLRRHLDIDFQPGQQSLAGQRLFRQLHKPFPQGGQVIVAHSEAGRLRVTAVT